MRPTRRCAALSDQPKQLHIWQNDEALPRHLAIARRFPRSFSAPELRAGPVVWAVLVPQAVASATLADPPKDGSAPRVRHLILGWGRAA